jgi:hypothetical protein
MTLSPGRGFTWHGRIKRVKRCAKETPDARKTDYGFETPSYGKMSEKWMRIATK